MTDNAHSGYRLERPDKGQMFNWMSLITESLMESQNQTSEMES